MPQFNGFEHGHSSGSRRYHSQHCEYSFGLILDSNMLTTLGFTGHDWSYRHDSHSKTEASRSSIAVCFERLIGKNRTWTSKDDMEEMKESDPGLAIASSVPIHRLGIPEEVANVVVM